MEKILLLPSLLEQIQIHREAGDILVFTNGCFDLLHVGHIRYLQEAKELGDRLVVGLNSDNSVRQLAKGQDRPIIPETQRAEVLAALTCVDYVTIFNESDPLVLIEAIQPNILVKGGDWTPDQIVGKEFVETRGGMIRTFPLVPNISTTGIIERILLCHGLNPTSS